MAENSLRVFVTNATEGLGRAVIRLLVVHGHSVTGMAGSLEDANQVRADGGLPVYNGLFRASEIASSLKLGKIDVVVNTATQGVNGLPVQRIDWGHYHRVLGEGAAAIAEAAALAEAKFIVHTSCTFLYGDTHHHAVDESAALDTHDPLFAAGAAGEQAVLTGSVPACVLRAGYNYGPGNASIQALHQALIDRRSLNLGQGEPAAWVHGMDLAAAIVAAVEQQPAGEIFNIAGDDFPSAGKFADLFAKTMGVPEARRMNLPPALQEMRNPSTQRAMLNSSVQVDSSKAKAQLGWKPEYPSVQAGIDQIMLAWRATQSV